MKYILPFLFALGACTHPTPATTSQLKTDTSHQTAPPVKSPLIRKGDTTILSTFINNRPIEVFSIADSILRLSQEGEQTITIPFETELFAYNSSMDINRDNQNDLFIYSHPNMHGQMIPFVFISNKEGKLCYRPDLSICNLCYDTATKQIVSFYIGGVYSEHSKDLYIWENDSLKLVRGVLMSLEQDHAGMFKRLDFYKGDMRRMYRLVTEDCEAVWDTAIFSEYPMIDFHE